MDVQFYPRAGSERNGVIDLPLRSATDDSRSWSCFGEDVDIFEPFVTTRMNGTGLGLFVVRRIIAAHKGTIGFTSKPGQGTVFRLPGCQTVRCQAFVLTRCVR
ncbi:MAG: ATP-binding protein [Alphaproteobacteria bacterium]